MWVFESNLMWSARLTNSLRKLGHEAGVLSEVPTDQTADVAILNLGEAGAPELIARLRELGVVSIAHAGHKERELLDVGRDSGADIVSTNSELTYKLPQLLERAKLIGTTDALPPSADLA